MSLSKWGLLERGEEWKALPKNAILPLLACLAWKWLQTETNMLLIITSTGDELLRCVNIDDLKWPLTPKIRGFSTNILLQAPKSCRNLLHKPSYSQFCPKFRCHGNGGRWGKCYWHHSMAHPRKPRYRRQNLAKNLLPKPSYSQFVRNFNAMATGLNGGKTGVSIIGTIN